MKTIETVGKDIEQALNAGFAELGCKPDDVDVKILVHPGIFRKARVRMTYIGGDDEATVEKKTAASVMRNVEERTRNAENNADNRRQSEHKQKQQKQALQQKQRTDAQNVNQKKQQKPESPERKEQPKEQPKKDFTRDFRAELNATVANDEKPVQSEKPANNKSAQGDKPVNNKPVQSEKPKVQHTPEEIAAVREKAVAYLKEVTTRMGVETDCVCEVKDGDIEIKFTSSDDMLIGYRGETIEALEYLAMLAANDSDSKYVHINLDAGDYRARRNEMLVQYALAKADKAVTTGRRVELEPMSSVNRRVVHAALGNRSDVITRSEGKEPGRYIVIIPKNAQNAVGGNYNRHSNNARRRDNRQRGNGNSGGNKEADKK